MAYEKLYNEIYAVVSLKYLWPEYQPDFIKGESPDWLNDNMDFGLEVSQALLRTEGQDGSFIDKYLGCRKEELPREFVEKYGERLHFYNNRFWAILPDPEITEDFISKAKYRFERKLEKLNTSYTRRRINGLYLYLHTSDLNENEIQVVYDFMRERQIKEKHRFDLVFLNCVKSIYLCDYRNDTLTPIILPKNAENFLDLETEYLRYCGEWPDGMSLEEASLLFQAQI